MKAYYSPPVEGWRKATGWFSFILLLASALTIAACAATKDVAAVGGARLGPARPANTVALRAANVGGTKIASISSLRSKEFTATEIHFALEDLRHKGARAGVDAVTNIRVLRDWRRGFINDPHVPFTAITQGSQNLYFLRGDGVKFAGGKAPTGKEPAPQAFVTAELPKGQLSIGAKKQPRRDDFAINMPGQDIVNETAPYIDAAAKKQ